MYKKEYTNVQVCKCANVQVWKCASVHVCIRANVQVCKCASMQECQPMQSLNVSWLFSLSTRLMAIGLVQFFTPFPIFLIITPSMFFFFFFSSVLYPYLLSTPFPAFSPILMSTTLMTHFISKEYHRISCEFFAQKMFRMISSGKIGLNFFSIFHDFFFIYMILLLFSAGNFHTIC